VWRVVLAKIATLSELDTHYSFMDLVHANDALDVQEEMEREAHDKMTKGLGKGGKRG